MNIISLKYLIKILRPIVSKIIRKKNCTVIQLISVSDLKLLLKILKSSSIFRCSILNHITGVDYLGYPGRSDIYIYYCLRTVCYNHQIVIEVGPFKRNNLASELVDSITMEYASASWFEREIYDMFGIYFKNHPDLRRILTDYGFKHHPLKKDFPLTGFKEIRYDDRTHGLLSEDIEFAQLPKPKFGSA